MHALGRPKLLSFSYLFVIVFLFICFVYFIANFSLPFYPVWSFGD